jgi:hypothetical protein
VGESPEKHPHIGDNWKNNVMTNFSCEDWRWMTLARDPCTNPGFSVRDVHIKTEHIFRFCDHSINVYSSHRGKFYILFGIFSAANVVLSTLQLVQLCWQDNCLNFIEKIKRHIMKVHVLLFPVVGKTWKRMALITCTKSKVIFMSCIP